MTGGLLNTQHLLTDPDALACFLYQGLIEEIIPSQLRSIYKVAGDALSFVDHMLKGPWKRAAEASGRPCENSFTPGALKEAYDKYSGSKGTQL